MLHREKHSPRPGKQPQPPPNTHTGTISNIHSLCARSRFAKTKKKLNKNRKQTNANAASYKYIYYTHNYKANHYTIHTTYTHTPTKAVHIYIVRKAPHRVRRVRNEDEMWKIKVGKFIATMIWFSMEAFMR